MFKEWYKVPYDNFLKWHILFDIDDNAMAVCNTINIDNLKISQLCYRTAVPPEDDFCHQCREIWEDYNKHIKPENTTKIIQIRIPIVVSSDGDYAVFEWNHRENDLHKSFNECIKKLHTNKGFLYRHIISARINPREWESRYQVKTKDLN